jgi:hypothetical protein
MAEIEAENASWVRTAKDLFAGAAGGVAQVLLGKLYLQFFTEVSLRGCKKMGFEKAILEMLWTKSRIGIHITQKSAGFIHEYALGKTRSFQPARLEVSEKLT